MSSDPGQLPVYTLPDPFELASSEPEWLTEPACCCPSRPRFQVLVPTAGSADVTDLLLCGHHLQASLPRLAEIGAWVVDQRNRRLAPADWL